jgi:hypothetical protein
MAAVNPMPDWTSFPDEIDRSALGIVPCKCGREFLSDGVFLTCWRCRLSDEDRSGCGRFREGNPRWRGAGAMEDVQETKYGLDR